MGRKIKDSELIGIPWAMIIGKKYEENNQIEIHREEWSNNYLNFNVENFAIECRGSLHDIVNEIRQRFDIAQRDIAGNDGDTSIL